MDRGDDGLGLSEGHYNSFVLRIWSRQGDIAQGTITHVATRQSLRFKDFQRMLAFVLHHVARTEQGGFPALDEPMDDGPLPRHAP